MKKDQQRGVALVVAMLIVAIATIIATQIFYQQQITIRRTLNQLQAEQLYQLALSTEAWVKVILKEDLTKNKFDYSGDNWAQNMALFDAEGAVIKTRIIDYQSCFNINNLVLNGKAQPEQIKILQALMAKLKLNPELVWPLVDWLDAGDEPYPAGAEWETYSRLTPSYRAANFRIVELTELYAISGWKTATINTLSPYICALPPAPQFTATGRSFTNGINSPININTASEMLLRSLSPDMQNANLGVVLEDRKKKGYNSVAVFLTQLDKDNPKEPKLSSTLKKEFLSVDSHYFMLEYSSLLDKLEQNYRSLIYRNSNQQLNTLYRLQYY
jgi:general secretion pathway protein K